jgi:GNAT superfamily N-acetyltransferase
VRIRRADTEDAEAVASIHLRARRAAPGIPPGVHPDEDAPRWVRERLMVAGEVWVAEDGDGSLLGMAATRPGWVDALYVEPDRWGEGVGSALLDVARGVAGEVVDLWCFAANTRARRFYEAHGFVAVEETDGSGNEEGAPDVRYQWRR